MGSHGVWVPSVQQKPGEIVDDGPWDVSALGFAGKCLPCMCFVCVHSAKLFGTLHI